MSVDLVAAKDVRHAPASLGLMTTRVLDILVSASALLLLSLLMLVVAVAVIVEGGRPIFFSQVRLGRGGRRFRMYKFRKFSKGERSVGGPLTVDRDPRLTRVGGLLARTKLDELPQLWNVLRGDMAIVGPRPESLAFQDCFNGPYAAVLDHKPGIFGPSQALFRNEGRLYRGCPDPEQFYRDIVFPLKAELDLAYFPRRTLPRDIVWLVRGGLAVCSGSSGLRRVNLLVERRRGWVERGDAGSHGSPLDLGLLGGVCEPISGAGAYAGAVGLAIGAGAPALRPD